MADRADYLARTLITRLTHLHASFAEDGRGEPERRQRIEAIGKVLAIELGLTDGTTLALIESAAPNPKTMKPAPPKEIAAFAEFLRRRLDRELSGD